MKQNINLYLPEFRKEKDWLDALRMVQILGVCVIALAAYSGYAYWQNSRLESQFALLDQQRQAAVTATTTLRASFGAQSEDQSLLSDIAEAETALQTKQAILQFMTGRDMGNNAGFSEYLADLARYHTQGLSLTNISLQNGGAAVSLAGQVLRTELVPLYLQNLSKGASFKGKDFYTLQINESVSGSNENTAPAWLFAVSTIHGAGR